ncbi:hypothetical protein GKODMF_07090 [Candidatus Electrothrix gigas]
MSITEKPTKGYHTIRLPLEQTEYELFLSDKDVAKAQIDKLYSQYPELFPEEMMHGYVLNGFTQKSSKLGLCCRRIQLKTADKRVFTIAPSFVMPYMRGLTAEMEKALFLRRFGVPFWGLTYVFGHNDMFWYRAEASLGNFSVTGTTVKDPQKLPQDLLADEKHTWLNGNRRYIAMTVGADCILGASVAKSASQLDLTKAYGVFAQEAKAVKPDYSPFTVNTDGWSPTQKAWLYLFPGVFVILCFLHAFLKIRDRATKGLKEWFEPIKSKVWEAYRAPTKAAFAQRLRRLREWTEKAVPDSPMKQHTLDLCAKREQFIRSYDCERAHRTSNMVDRLMKFIDRVCFDAQYFHGTDDSAEQHVRAMALLWNFCPSSPATIKKHQGKTCPAERLNGKRYADNWLENLLVSATMNGGIRGYQQKTL